MEQQAFARIYRIGQKQETELLTMVVKNTIEDRMMDIKARKDGGIERVMAPLEEAEVIWRPFKVKS